MNKLSIFLASLCCLPAFVIAQSTAMDSTFGGTGFVQSGLRKTGFQPYTTVLGVSQAGDVFIGGSGVFGNPNWRVNQYNAAGDSVAVFKKPIHFEAIDGVTALKVQDDGKLIFNESFKWLARFLPDGQLDSTFGINGQTTLFNIYPSRIAFSQDGRMFVAGKTANNGAGVAAYDQNGIPDTSFASNGFFYFSVGTYDFYFDFEFLSDGSIILGGFSHYSNGSGRPILMCKVTPSGTLDPNFGTGGYLHFKHSDAGGEIYGIVVQPDDKIVVTGYDFTPYRGYVTRFHPNGVIDSTFGKNGTTFLNTIAEGVDLLLRPDGRLLVYCWLDPEPYINKASLIQLLPNGKIDPSFGIQGEFVFPHKLKPPMSISFLGDNKVVACGLTEFPGPPNMGSSSYYALLRIILDLNVGTLDPSSGRTVEQLLAYPNPVSEAFNLTFKLETAQSLQFDLYDMQGRLVQTLLGEQRFASGSHELLMQLDGLLPAGQYALSVRADGRRVLGLLLVKG